MQTLKTLLSIALALTLTNAASAEEFPLTKYVDLRIGSEGLGRVFIGPTCPFGMVKPSPDCTPAPNNGWDPMPTRVGRIRADAHQRHGRRTKVWQHPGTAVLHGHEPNQPLLPPGGGTFLTRLLRHPLPGERHPNGDNHRRTGLALPLHFSYRLIAVARH